MDDSKCSRGQRRVHLHVTAFGPFSGVAENPTEIVVARHLAAQLASRTDTILGRLQVHVDVMEVSTSAADATIETVRERILRMKSATPDDGHVLLHFGVAAGTASFNLEQQGINEARFRVPDQQGVKLDGLPIDDSEPLGCRRLSALPMPALAHDLRALGHRVKASDDAGRFLCNWITYRSLALAEDLCKEFDTPSIAANSAADGHGADAHASDEASAPVPGDPPVVSLFVHVPSFGDPAQGGLDLAQHVAFAADLVCLLGRIMLPAGASVSAGEGRGPAPEGGECFGGVATYARRMAPVLAALPPEHRASLGFGSSTASESRATAAAAALSGAGADGASTPPGSAVSREGLLAGADLAAKSGDIATADALRALAASMRVQGSVSNGAGSPASGGSGDHSALPARQVLWALLQAGFPESVCRQAVVATAPTGAAVLGIGDGAAQPAPRGDSGTSGDDDGDGDLTEWVGRAMEWVVVSLEGEEEEEVPAPAPAPASALRGASVGASPSAAPLQPQAPSPALAFPSFPTQGGHKMTVVVRGDLGMGAGKVAAQACHAALKAHRRVGGSSPAGARLLEAWSSHGEPIVVLRCADEGELTTLIETAQAVGLPASSVRDAGRTQVAAGSLTCAAFGPAPIAAVDAITGHLKLY